MNPNQQQKLAQIETQEITQMLQSGRTLGTNKLLVNVNGQSSKIISNKNGIIKYTMEQPVKLNIGDTVTLIDSFVEERGLAEDTIEIEEDIVEEMRFLYYTQGDLRNTQITAGDAPYSGVCADQEFTHFPSFFPDGSFGENTTGNDPTLNFDDSSKLTLLKMNAYNIPMFPTWNYLNTPPGCGNTMKSDTFVSIEKFGNLTNGQACDKPKLDVTCGATGQYYYMMEWFSPAVKDKGNRYSWQSDPQLVPGIATLSQKCFMRPMYGAAVITVPAGNYSVSALSDLINDQLNGTIASATDTSQTLLDQRLFSKTDEKSFQITVPPFSGLFSSSIEPTTTSNIARYNPDSLVIGPDTFQPFQRRRGGVVTQFYFNSDITANRVNLQTMRYIANGSNANAVWNNNQTMIQYNEMPVGTAPVNRLDYHLSVTSDELLQLRDPIYGGGGDLRRFNSNFFLHLEGMRYLFENDNNQYYNQIDTTEEDIIERFNPSDFPTLADLFLCNVGRNGLKYFEQDPDKWNHGGYDVSGIADVTKYPWHYSDQPEDYIFSCMFGVRGAGDDTRPMWEYSDAEKWTSKDGYPAGVSEETCFPVSKPLIQQFAGTTAIEISFDVGKSNRFQISNLHEPYKVQSHDAQLNGTTGLGGQETTSLNYPCYYDFTKLNSAKEAIPVYNAGVNAPCGLYPIEAVSGIAVNNFSFSTVKNTKVYTDLVAKIAENNVDDHSKQMYREKLIYDLFTKPYDEFFNTEVEAKVAWSKSLWARIGFDYDQIGNVSNKLESVFSFSNPFQPNEPTVQRIDKVNKIKHTGIITHNAYDNTFIPSSGGLGVANPYNKKAASASTSNPQSFGLRTCGLGVNLTTALTKGFAQNRVNILSNTQPISANSFPALNNGNNYLIIESDIVKANAKDAKSNETTIVGIISKENANNDTLFHNTPIPFIVTEPKLLSTIEVRIRNPDGTLVSDDIVGKNNGFIFQIEKPIAPSSMTMSSF